MCTKQIATLSIFLTLYKKWLNLTRAFNTFRKMLSSPTSSAVGLEYFPPMPPPLLLTAK